MRDLIFKKKFSKDVARIKRTGRDMSLLAEVIDFLAEGRLTARSNAAPAWPAFSLT
jgi:mRNA-degrading endonuclease YafQ of YafQ-DinJ toxin-antitoxin module